MLNAEIAVLKPICIGCTMWWKAILGVIASLGIVLLAERYQPISTLIIENIAAGIAANKAQLLAQPSPFEDINQLDIQAESENAILFADINPQAPHHFLIVPKKRVYSVLEADPALMGEMLALAREFAMEQGFAEDGFRLVINTNPKGLQSVYHLHIHLLAGRQMLWPPG